MFQIYINIYIYLKHTIYSVKLFFIIVIEYYYELTLCYYFFILIGKHFMSLETN